MHFDKMFHEVQADARAGDSGRRGCAKEALEQLFEFLLRNADALVAHRNDDIVLITTMRGQPDRCPFRCIFDGVGQEVREDLAQQLLVSGDRRWQIADVIDDRVPGIQFPISTGDVSEQISDITVGGLAFNLAVFVRMLSIRSVMRRTDVLIFASMPPSFSSVIEALLRSSR